VRPRCAGPANTAGSGVRLLMWQRLRRRRLPNISGSRKSSRSFARPAFPSPVAPGWNGNPWALPLSFTPDWAGPSHACQGRDRSSNTNPSYVLDIMSNLLRSYSPRATSRRTISHRRLLHLRSYTVQIAVPSDARGRVETVARSWSFAAGRYSERWSHHEVRRGLGS
jgi:hypothetical protein